MPQTGVRGRNYTGVYATNPSWTPDGRLSYSFHPEIRPDWPASCSRIEAHCGWVWTTRPDGSNRRPLMEGRDAHWSPDGLTIVFTPSNGGVATLSARTETELTRIESCRALKRPPGDPLIMPTRRDALGRLTSGPPPASQP